MSPSQGVAYSASAAASASASVDLNNQDNYSHAEHNRHNSEDSEIVISQAGASYLASLKQHRNSLPMSGPFVPAPVPAPADIGASSSTSSSSSSSTAASAGVGAGVKRQFLDRGMSSTPMSNNSLAIDGSQFEAAQRRAEVEALFEGSGSVPPSARGSARDGSKGGRGAADGARGVKSPIPQAATPSRRGVLNLAVSRYRGGGRMDQASADDLAALLLSPPEPEAGDAEEEDAAAMPEEANLNDDDTDGGDDHHNGTDNGHGDDGDGDGDAEGGEGEGSVRSPDQRKGSLITAQRNVPRLNIDLASSSSSSSSTPRQSSARATLLVTPGRTVADPIFRPPSPSDGITVIDKSKLLGFLKMAAPLPPYVPPPSPRSFLSSPRSGTLNISGAGPSTVATGTGAGGAGDGDGSTPGTSGSSRSTTPVHGRIQTPSTASGSFFAHPSDLMPASIKEDGERPISAASPSSGPRAESRVGTASKGDRAQQPQAGNSTTPSSSSSSSTTHAKYMNPPLHLLSQAPPPPITGTQRNKRPNSYLSRLHYAKTGKWEEPPPATPATSSFGATASLEPQHPATGDAPSAGGDGDGANAGAGAGGADKALTTPAAPVLPFPPPPAPGEGGMTPDAAIAYAAAYAKVAANAAAAAAAAASENPSASIPIAQPPVWDSSLTEAQAHMASEYYRYMTGALAVAGYHADAAALAADGSGAREHEHHDGDVDSDFSHSHQQVNGGQGSGATGVPPLNLQGPGAGFDASSQMPAGYTKPHMSYTPYSLKAWQVRPEIRPPSTLGPDYEREDRVAALSRVSKMKQVANKYQSRNNVILARNRERALVPAHPITAMFPLSSREQGQEGSDHSDVDGPQDEADLPEQPEDEHGDSLDVDFDELLTSSSSTSSSSSSSSAKAPLSSTPSSTAGGRAAPTPAPAPAPAPATASGSSAKPRLRLKAGAPAASAAPAASTGAAAVRARKSMLEDASSSTAPAPAPAPASATGRARSPPTSAALAQAFSTASQQPPASSPPSSSSSLLPAPSSTVAVAGRRAGQGIVRPSTESPASTGVPPSPFTSPSATSGTSLFSGASRTPAGRPRPTPTHAATTTSSASVKTSPSPQLSSAGAGAGGIHALANAFARASAAARQHVGSAGSAAPSSSSIPTTTTSSSSGIPSATASVGSSPHNRSQAGRASTTSGNPGSAPGSSPVVREGRRRGEMKPVTPAGPSAGSVVDALTSEHDAMRSRVAAIKKSMHNM